MISSYKNELNKNQNDISKYIQKFENSHDDEINKRILYIFHCLQILYEKKEFFTDEDVAIKLSDIYNSREYLKYFQPAFLNEVLNQIFQNYMKENADNILNCILKLLKYLISKSLFLIPNLFTDSYFNFVTFCLSKINHHFINKTLSLISIMSKTYPENCLVYFDLVKNKLNNDNSDLITPYIFNILPFILQNQTFSYDELFQMIETFLRANRQSKFDGLAIIKKGIDHGNIPFIQYFSQPQYISFFNDLIHQKSSTLINLGYSIFSSLFSHIKVGISPIFSNQYNIYLNEIFDKELIYNHLLFHFEENSLIFHFKKEVVKSCLTFLIELMKNNIICLQVIFENIQENTDENIINQIILIVLHSCFDIRILGTTLLFIALKNGSSQQILSLSLIYIIEAIIEILKYNPNILEESIDCLKRVILIFSNSGTSEKGIQEIFCGFEGPETINEILESESSKVAQVKSLYEMMNLKL